MKCLILALFLTFSSAISANDPARTFLEKKFPKDNIRYDSFSYALDLLEERNVQTIVETGTSRSGSSWYLTDGCSTLIFAQWARNQNATLYSVDIDYRAIQKAKFALRSYSNSVHLIHSDSVEFLEKFNQPIDFLYLDSFDFDLNDPFPSQEHHLKEIIAAYPLLKDTSIVMIDDCDLPHGGKGKYVIQYLLERGWVVVWDGYQVILVKEEYFIF